MNLEGLRVGFAGTPEFAAVALRALVAANANLALVLTQPDRPAGRGLKLQASAVKQLAVNQQLAIAQPRSLRLDGKFPADAAAAQAALQAAQLDVLVVAAYGLLLPQWVLDTPRWGCLNIHASLLPRWRGAAPIHRAIEAGDAQTGVTIMQMDAGLDTGDMLLALALPIAPTDTTASLHDKLASLGAQLVVQAIAHAALGRHSPQVQPTQGITYAHKLEKTDALLDWTLPASTLQRKVRAFNPNPGAWTWWQGEVFKVWECNVFDSKEVNKNEDTGAISIKNSTEMHVACGQGSLVLSQVQRAGGKRMAAIELLKGGAVLSGQRLGSQPA